MKVLVIGGTGLVGVHTAELLRQHGHDVAIGGRHPAEEVSPVADLPFVAGDYTRGDFDVAALTGYDAVVFAAGSDVRHIGPDDDALSSDYWARQQAASVPAVASAAKRAGVHRFVQIGSCYHVVRPDLAAVNPYVQARRDADERARALASDDFVAVTLNPPPIVGSIPGVSQRRFAKMVAWARGELDDRFPGLVAPPGGTNYLSVRSLAEAVEGALLHGEPGAAYLVGDQNLTYAEYFQAIVDLAGGSGRVEVVDAEHPFLPDRMIVPGRGAMLSFEPPEEEVRVLGYRRDDVVPMLAAMIAAS